MRKIYKLLFAGLLAFCVPLCVTNDTFAQNSIHGTYNPKKPGPEKKPFQAPIPKVFSSKLSSTAPAETMDALYYNLQVSLWNFSGTNFNHQGLLLGHMAVEKFVTSRYAKEFTPDLKKGMAALNKTHKDLEMLVQDTDVRYSVVREDVEASEQALADELWNEKKALFLNKSEAYFKMQHRFLVMYKALAEFVVKKGGSYYYADSEKAVKFMNVGDYTYFAKTIDDLVQISKDQKKLLRGFMPSMIDQAEMKPVAIEETPKKK